MCALFSMPVSNRTLITMLRAYNDDNGIIKEPWLNK